MFIPDQGREELHFWKDKLRSLNIVLFLPEPFAPNVVVFSDASASTCAACIEGSGLTFQRNWSSEESLLSST